MVFSSLEEICEVFSLPLPKGNENSRAIVELFNTGIPPPGCPRVWIGHYNALFGKTDGMNKEYQWPIKQGNLTAMTMKGYHYSNIGNIKKMIRFYKMAIERGSDRAMFLLADYYATVNNTEAVELYLRALELGNSEAAGGLESYYDNLGMKEQATKYGRLASQVGNVFKNYYLGMYYEGTPEERIKYLKQFLVDVKQEIDRLLAIQMGLAENLLKHQINHMKKLFVYSAAVVGNYYYAHDPKTAMQYYCDAHQMNENDAIIVYNIASAYQLLDESENAKEYYIKAFKGGCSKAMDKLKNITDDIELYILCKKNTVQYPGPITDSIQIYENKLLMATTEECGICFSEGTCVLTSCFRHRVCTDCYSHCYKVCPYCRVKNM